MNYNKIMLGGRMTAAPELKQTQGGMNVLRFTVAVNRSKKDETDFIDCVAFNQTAENISKYFTKGSAIFVEGRLNINAYTDKEGNKRRAAAVAVDRFEFVDKKEDKPAAPSFDELEEIEDLPF